jgi:hypothetical protein
LAVKSNISSHRSDTSLGQVPHDQEDSNILSYFPAYRTKRAEALYSEIYPPLSSEKSNISLHRNPSCVLSVSPLRVPGLPLVPFRQKEGAQALGRAQILEKAKLDSAKRSRLKIYIKTLFPTDV